MSEASETARAELVAAEILHEGFPVVVTGSPEDQLYDRVAAMVAAAYARGRHEATIEHLAALERIVGDK